VQLIDEVTPGATKASAAVRDLTATMRENERELLRLQKLQHELGDSEAERSIGRARAKDIAGLRLEQRGLALDAKAANDAVAAGGPEFAGAGAALSVLAVGAVASADALYHIGEIAVTTGLEVTETNRRLVATFEALGSQGEGSGDRTLDFLDRLSTQLPQTREQLATWTKQFEALGITNLDELRHQILATASAQAVMGDEGAAAYQKITERVRVAIEEHKGLKLAEKSLKGLYEAGLNVTEVASAIGMTTEQLAAGLKAGTVDAVAFGNALSDTLIEKGKGSLEAMGDEIATLRAKGKETLRHLFDDVDTAPLTDAIQSVIHLGDEGQPSGDRLKDGVTTGVNGAIKALASLVTEAEVAGLEVEVFYLEHKHAIQQFFDVDVRGVVDGVREVIDDAKELVDLLSRVKSTLDGVNPLHAASIDDDNAFKRGMDALGLSPQRTEPDAPRGIELSSGASGSPGNEAPSGTATIQRHRAHADGGVIHAPAPGEFFASVAPGEQIVPVGGGDGGIHVHGNIEIHVHAAAGVTDAQQLSMSGFAAAIERLQLARGA
jgi:hypothetical protein